jgi:hypothetical protein
MSPSGTKRTCPSRRSMSAYWGKALMVDVSPMSGFDPGCVKTHTSGKCRKHNSLTWHPSVCPQHYQFSRRAISPRCFYARGGRWSFHTAWTQSGPSRCPAGSARIDFRHRAVFLESVVIVECTSWRLFRVVLVMEVMRPGTARCAAGMNASIMRSANFSTGSRKASTRLLSLG